jgi:hypothetical protein
MIMEAGHDLRGHVKAAVMLQEKKGRRRARR